MDRQETLRVGMLGAGLVALGVHLRNLPRMAEIEVAGLSEPDTARQARARHVCPSIRLYSSHDALLSDPSIDAVIIAVPYEEHANVAIRAIGAGKDVYLEKPFCTEADDAEPLLRAWQTSGAVGMMGFNYRHHPLLAALEREIRGGTIGEPLAIRTSFSFAPHGGVDWDITRHGAFGALFDLGPHHIDLVRFLMKSEVTSVEVRAQSVATRNDTAMLQMQLSNGCTAQCFLSTQCLEEHTVTVYGRGGGLTADLYRSLSLSRSPIRAAERTLPDRLGAPLHTLTKLPYLIEKLRAPWHEPSFRPALSEFFTAIREGRQATPDFRDGYQSQLVIAAALESLESRRAIGVAPH